MATQSAHRSVTQRSNEDSAQRDFGDLWNEALRRYKEETKQDLLTLPFASDLLSQPHTTETIIQYIRERSERFEAFRTGGKKILGVLKPIVYLVHLFIDTGAESAAASDAVPGGKAIFVAVGALLQTTQGVTQLYDTVESLLLRIKEYLERVGMHLRPSIPPSPILKKILLETLIQVFIVLAIVTKYCNVAVKDGIWLKNAMRVVSRRTKDYFRVIVNKTDMAEALRKLENLTRAELQTTAVHTNAIARADFVYDKTVIDDIHSWLRPPNPRPLNYQKKRHADSCRWFFDDRFVEWKARKNGVYWVWGNAGAGKSVLCSSVIDALSNDRARHLAYFYFDFSDPEKQDCRGLVASLVFQIGTCSRDCLDYLQRQHSFGPSDGYPSYEKLLAMFSHLLCLSGPTFLVIDAIDECPEPARDAGLQGFFEHLSSLNSEHEDFHLLVTSRPESDIRGYLSHYATQSLSFHDARKHMDDLHDYIATQIYETEFYHWADNIKAKAQRILDERSNGMFLWVNIQLRHLRHCASRDVERTLDDLPSDLYETYERILKSFPPKSAMINRARHVFECVAFAQRPLSLPEVIEIFSMNLDGPEALSIGWDDETHIDDPEAFVLEKCPGLLDVVTSKEGHKIVQFIHFSVKQYLVSSKLQQAFPAYWVNDVFANLTLAKICLLTLTLGDSHSDFRSYANEHWFEHISIHNANDLNKLLSRFLHIDSPAFALWAHGQHEPHGQLDTALHWAARLGLYHHVERILEDSQGDIVLFMLSDNIVRSRGVYEETALHGAARWGHVDVARILLDYGASIDDADEDGSTPLHHAASSGHLDVVRVLLDYPAADGSNAATLRCLARDRNGQTALHVAVREGHAEVSRFLLQHGALADDAGDKHGDTPLHLAARFGYLDVVRTLLKHPTVHGLNAADLRCRARNELGWTPLHAAARWGHIGVSRILLKHGALVHDADNHGQAPLQLAEKHGHWDFVRILSNRRATVAEGSDATPFSAPSVRGHHARGALHRRGALSEADVSVHAILSYYTVI